MGWSLVTEDEVMDCFLKDSPSTSAASVILNLATARPAHSCRDQEAQAGCSVVLQELLSSVSRS